MRQVTRSYEAYHLRCLRCGEARQAVYLVTRWSSHADEASYMRQGRHVAPPWSEHCTQCGAEVQVARSADEVRESVQAAVEEASKDKQVKESGTPCPLTGTTIAVPDVVETPEGVRAGPS